MCERAKKNKRNFFFNRMTYIRIVVINLIIMNLFRVCPVIFPLKRKKVFHVNICVLYVISILDC